MSGRPRIQKRIDPELAGLYLATIQRIAELVADPIPVAAHTRDVDDDYLVALAREHGADYIVTGDGVALLVDCSWQPVATGGSERQVAFRPVARCRCPTPL